MSVETLAVSSSELMVAMGVYQPFWIDTSPMIFLVPGLYSSNEPLVYVSGSDHSG